MIEAVNDTSILILGIGSFFSICIFIFSIYFFNRWRLKKFVIFDISFIIILVGLISGRLVGIINNWHEYKDLGIGIFPLEEISGRIRIVDTLPWEFLKINDGNFFIWGIPIGMILAIVIIYLISNRTKEYLNFADGIIIAFLPAKLILIITQLISFTYYGKETGLLNIFIPDISTYRSNLAIIELFVFIVVFIILIFINLKVKKDGLIYFMYVLYEVFVGFFLVSSVFYSRSIAFGLETSQLISIVLLVLLVLWGIKGLVKTSFRKKKVSTTNTDGTVSSDNLIMTSELTDIQMSTSKGIIGRIKKIFGNG